MPNPRPPRRTGYIHAHARLRCDGQQQRKSLRSRSRQKYHPLPARWKKGPDLGYIPSSPEVLYNTCLIQPETSQSIYFTAPLRPGDYPYLCTYPGHYLTMHGIMKVVHR